MVSAPPGARGLLTLLLLLPLPGARGLCGTLPRFSHAVPRDTNRTEGFPVDTQVTYRCLGDFAKIPGKSDTVVCLSTLEWSTIEEFCGRGCGAPPRLKSAALNKEDEIKNYCPPGTNVSYVCRPGYERTELKLVITCLENLTWSEAPEFCRGKSCGVPKGPEHGRAVDITNDLYGARVNIICDEGFRLRGRTFIQCLPKGDQVEWSQLPTCQAITCSPPPYIANGMHNGSNVEIFEYSSSVTYKCDDNFSLTGESSIHCTTKDNINAVWNGSAPECKVICDSPPRLSFAELPGVVNNSYPVGTELKYSCRPGYILGSGKSPFATCLANSTWSVDPEFCVGRPCKPLELGNGRVDLTDLRFGATANFSCNEGYRLIGTTSAQCTLVGNGVDWDKELPLCQAIPCLPPPDITHGSHTGQSEQEFFFGSAVTYKCDQGFSLIGEASIHCTTKDNVNGEWSGPAPECKVIITQDKPTTVPPKGAEVTSTSSGSALNTAGNSAEPEGGGLCGTLPTFSHAVPRDTNHTEGFPVDTKVTYRCLGDFAKIPGKSDTVVCLSTLEWSTIEEFCGPITCSSPPNIANGMHNGSNVEIFVYNSSVTYKCDDSFSLTGEASIHCTMKDNINGVWNGSAPECKVIIIQDKPTPVHRKGAEGAGTSSGSALNTAGNSAEPEGGGPGIDTHIGVIIIGIIIGIGIIGNNIGMFAALNKKWQKKKGSYSVNPDSSKHQNTTEHDFHINESKCNLIFKV